MPDDDKTSDPAIPPQFTPSTSTATLPTHTLSTPALVSDVTVNRVAVKVPPFWEESPEIWFAQVEAQFANAGVSSDDSRFNTVVAAIESKILMQITDAVLHPPDTGKYRNLKTVLLENFGASEQQKIRKLLSEIELGDRKPTQLLNEMRHLGGSQISEQLLHTLWSNRLPAQVRAILQASPCDLKGKAVLADKIMEVSGCQQVNEVSPDTSSLEKKIEQIDRQLQQLIRQSSSRGRSKSRSRNKPEKRDSTPSTSNQCWYHMKFGDKARRCRSPCSSKN